MADSDGEYRDGGSDDEYGDHQVSSSRGTRSGAGGRAAGKGQKGGRKPAPAAAWENVTRTWDIVEENADGTIKRVETAEAKKRARLMRDPTPLQRGIIRHLVLVLDMSFAMAEKDLLPTRHDVAMAHAREFIHEYFEQNPISQLAIVGMRDGVALRISDMSGNPSDHLEKLETAAKLEPQGSPSLQNALEMCRGALFHTPSHGTREVLVVYGALMSSDPGDIHETINAVIKDRIRVSVVGIAAQVAICAELCAKTNGGDETGYYNVALHEQHLRELLIDVTTPPATRPSEQANASLLMMGFPSRTMATGDTINYCACHNRPTREGYECTRCAARVCRLPSECPGCGLTLILSTHLARSYHHLFPLRNWVDVPWSEAGRSAACHACQAPFPSPSKRDAADQNQVGLSESSRYACEVCGNHFCIDCDLFAHEVLHNCPGCQSGAVSQPLPVDGVNGTKNGTHVNGSSAMEVDS